MSLAEIRQLATDVKRIAQQAKATGPRSPEGKARSAINAVRHGLAGKNLLLPGEDAVEYERRMDGIFSSLAPDDEAQAQVVALVADDLWKLDRLARIEKGVTLGRIEELLGFTQSAEQVARTGQAMLALGNALNSWSTQPIPTERNGEFSRRLAAMSDAVNLVAVMNAGIPAAMIESYKDLIGKLYGEASAHGVSIEVYQALYEAAAKVMDLVMQQGDKDLALQDDLRKDIATIALPDEAELKKLARYRKMLEESVKRRLDALDQLRRMKEDHQAASKDSAEKAREFRVKLRLVS